MEAKKQKNNFDFSLKWDLDTNIFTDIFAESIVRINPGMAKSDAKRVFEDVSLALDNEDLGEAFFNMLISTSGIKLIDFRTSENFKKNNSFNVVTELTIHRHHSKTVYYKNG